MNSFMKYDYGSLANAYFEHTRRTDADFRRRVYDLRIAMYKSTYENEFDWPEHVPKSNVHQVEPGFATIPKPNGDQLKSFYTPKIVFRKLSDNKSIEPPLEYPYSVDKCNDKEYFENVAKSVYQTSYVNQTPSLGNQTEETPDEWVRKWKNECHNSRDADDLVQDLSRRVINAQKILLDRRRTERV